MSTTNALATALEKMNQCVGIWENEGRNGIKSLNMDTDYEIMK